MLQRLYNLLKTLPVSFYVSLNAIFFLVVISLRLLYPSFTLSLLPVTISQSPSDSINMSAEMVYTQRGNHFGKEKLKKKRKLSLIVRTHSQSRRVSGEIYRVYYYHGVPGNR